MKVYLTCERIVLTGRDGDGEEVAIHAVCKELLHLAFDIITGRRTAKLLDYKIAHQKDSKSGGIIAIDIFKKES